MRRLMILRHAKTEPFGSRQDFLRELTVRGRDDARRMGQWMAQKSLAPDLAICSGAARARATCEIVAATMPRPLELTQNNAIYEARWSSLLDLTRELPASAHDVLLVGHNPGVADLANALTRDGPELPRLRMAGHYPTCGLAVIAFDLPDWSELAEGSGRLERFLPPSEIEMAGGSP